MATEEHKKANLVRMFQIMIQGLTKGLWDLFGESSFALMHPVGDQLLGIMQDEMGLEIGGESAKDVVNEVGRLFVDEFGWAEKISVTKADDDQVVVEVEQCKGFNLTLKLQALGVTHPFICPIMNVMSSAINKIKGSRPHEAIEPLKDVRGTRLTFKIG